MFVFPIVVKSELRLREYSDNDDRNDVPHFNQQISYLILGERNHRQCGVTTRLKNESLIKIRIKLNGFIESIAPIFEY